MDTETLALRAINECLGYQALRTARILSRYFNDAFKAVGLQGTQFSLLVTIRSHPGTSVASLADLLATDASTLVRNIAVLRARGLVHEDATRGRAGKRLRTTPEGDRLLDQALPIWNTAFERLKESLGDESTAKTLEALRTLERAADRPSPAD